MKSAHSSSNKRMLDSQISEKEELFDDTGKDEILQVSNSAQRMDNIETHQKIDQTASSQQEWSLLLSLPRGPSRSGYLRKRASTAPSSTTAVPGEGDDCDPDDESVHSKVEGSRPTKLSRKDEGRSQNDSCLGCRKAREVICDFDYIYAALLWSEENIRLELTHRTQQRDNALDKLQELVQVLNERDRALAKAQDELRDCDAARKRVEKQFEQVRDLAGDE